MTSPLGPALPTPHTAPTPAPPHPRSLGARLWPIAIGGVLALTMGANLYVMRLAGADPAAAVEADYYRKAVHYDAELAQARRNVALGWQLRPTLAPVGPDYRAALTVALTDRGGAPLTGAAVRVEAFAVARSQRTVPATLRPTAAGYVGTLPVGHLGRWELRITATRGAERFTAVERLDAVAAPSALP